MELQCKIEVNADGEKAFAYWTNEAKRKEWEDDLESLRFDGAIAVGAAGKMKLAGKPEMAFTIVEAIKGESYSDRYELPFGVLIFTHRLLREGGKSYLYHSVRLDKSPINDGDLGFLGGVFADFPATTLKLKALLEA